MQATHLSGIISSYSLELIPSKETDSAVECCRGAFVIFAKPTQQPAKDE